MESVPAKIVVIEDDQSTGEMLAALAREEGFECDHYTSLADMGSFAHLKNYDLAIIDYYLESLRGDEIAEYVDTFFHDIPVVIISAKDFNEEEAKRWPQPVKQFVSKTEGAPKIIATARAVLERMRLLKKFQGNDRQPQDPIETGRESRV